jgi:hypothetical protein
MYRFGDGTPFPLGENFLETLVAAVDCCVALYQVEATIDEHHTRVREAGRRAGEELHRLDALHGIVETALAPLMARQDPAGQRASEQAAARIFESAVGIIRNSRTGVLRKRDGAARQSLPPTVMQAVPAALGEFFGRHLLPRTEWHAHWQASGDRSAVAELTAMAPRHLELVFRASFADPFWGRPIPMAELFGGPVTATIEGPRGRPRQLRLDPALLIEVQVGPGREAIVLSSAAKGKRPEPWLHILMPRPGEAGPLAVALDRRDASGGQPFYLDHVSAAEVMGAWRALERELPALIGGRQELTGARLNGRAVSELEHPAQLAEAILLSMASLVREIRMRSRVPGELIIKRDLGPDRREEMFVPRQVLWSKLAGLPPRHRQLFEDIGLGEEMTREFVHRVSGPGAAPAPSPPSTTTAPTSPAPTAPSAPSASTAGPTRKVAPRPPASDDDDPESEVEVTNPRGEETSEVVSGLIERASA